MGQSGSIPQSIKGVAHDSGADDEHVFSGGARPAHTGSSEASLELLDATLDRAGTDGIAVFMKGLILHPALMVVILGPAVIAIMRQLGPVFNK